MKIKNRALQSVFLSMMLIVSVVSYVPMQAEAQPNNVCNCKGYAGPGGPCYAGPGGPAYDGPGGPAYSGPGGPCYAGPGGSQYGGAGGPAYSGPGGPRYDGPGGPAYDGAGGPAYSGAADLVIPSRGARGYIVLLFVNRTSPDVSSRIKVC